jgi:hypothetical protein
MSGAGENLPAERFSGFYRLYWTRNEMRGGFPVPLYDFVNDDVDPLTFHCADGRLLRPASWFKDFDHGSVPGRLQGLVPATCAPRAFVFHDSAFENHGHWVSKDGGKTWAFVELSQHQANHILYRLMVVEGNSEATAWKAFAGVQVGGKEMWHKHTGPFPTCPGYGG